jgi:hypothetical protein
MQSRAFDIRVVRVDRVCGVWDRVRPVGLVALLGQPCDLLSALRLGRDSVHG